MRIGIGAVLLTGFCLFCREAPATFLLPSIHSLLVLVLGGWGWVFACPRRATGGGLRLRGGALRIAQHNVACVKSAIILH